MTEFADPYCLKVGEASALLRGHPWRRFVVIGDSVAEGMGESRPGYRDISWTDRIAEALTAVRPDLVYRNLGTRNLTAAEVRARQLDDALAFEPDLAVVACGGFDIFHRTFDLDEVAAEIRAIVAALVGAGPGFSGPVSTLWARSCDVVTVGMFDGSHSPYVPDRLRGVMHRRLWQLADATAAISAEHGGIHVGLTSHPASKSPDLYGSDGRHGTMRGHAISAAECIRQLGESCRANRSKSA